MAPRVLIGVHVHEQRPPRGYRLDGIHQKVDQDLRALERVGPHGGEIGGDASLNGHARLPGLGLHER